MQSDSGDKSKEREGRRYGRLMLPVLGLAAALALVAGHFRSGQAASRLESLPAQQKALEKCASVAAEYRELQRQNPRIEDQGEHMGHLKDIVVAKLGIPKAWTGTRDFVLKETDNFVVRKYTMEFANISRKDAVMFLYEMKTADRNIIPAAVSVTMNPKETDLWQKAEFTFHRVFFKLGRDKMRTGAGGSSHGK